MVTVTLTRDELIFAAQGGVVRNIDALLRKRATYYGNPWRDLWANNVTGAMGECAVAKYYGRYWTPLYDSPTGVPDVGAAGQVRSSIRMDSPLRFYERDREDQGYMLVLARPPEFMLAGWLWGREGKRDEWKRGDGWEVPQASLRPVTPP